MSTRSWKYVPTKLICFSSNSVRPSATRALDADAISTRMSGSSPCLRRRALSPSPIRSSRNAAARRCDLGLARCLGRLLRLLLRLETLPACAGGRVHAVEGILPDAFRAGQAEVRLPADLVPNRLGGADRDRAPVVEKIEDILVVDLDG